MRNVVNALQKVHFQLIAWLLLASCSSPETKNTATTSIAPVSNQLMFSETQMKLANITTGPVGIRSLGNALVINGDVRGDQQSEQTISARIGGRIEKLFVKETGVSVKRGDPLYEVYSEVLVTNQNEYLIAKAQFDALGATEKRYSSLLAAAERKLLLLGLSKSQIEQLAVSGSASPRVKVVAPASGIVSSIEVSEGSAVEEGTVIFRLEDNTTLWVEAAMFPTEAELVKVGDNVIVADNSGTEVPAEVIFLSPERTQSSQVTVMRARLKNNGSFRRGMGVQVYIQRAKAKALAVPLDAVIRDEHGAHVYVQKGHNTFEPRQVVTGFEDSRIIEIKNGLSQGDTIAMSGAYMIYGEYMLKRGIDPMAANFHKH